MEKVKLISGDTATLWRLSKGTVAVTIDGVALAFGRTKSEAITRAEINIYRVRPVLSKVIMFGVDRIEVYTYGYEPTIYLTKAYGLWLAASFAEHKAIEVAKRKLQKVNFAVDDIVSRFWQVAQRFRSGDGFVHYEYIDLLVRKHVKLCRDRGHRPQVLTRDEAVEKLRSR